MWFRYIKSTKWWWNNNDDDASLDINKSYVRDYIFNRCSCTVAGIYLTFMLDKGDQDLQTFWNACINQTNVVLARTSLLRRF